MSKQSWSVIVSCYNEEHTIKSSVTLISEVLSKISNGTYEVIIVNDGSTDASAEIIDELAANLPIVKAHHHAANMGFGNALKSGYSRARYENVCAVPAAGQFDFKELEGITTVPEKTILSFYRKENVHYSMFRKLLSRTNLLLNRILIGIRLRDVNWIKIYKNSDLKKLDLKLSSLMVESEICAKLMIQGTEVIEKPSTYHKREYGRSKIISPKIISQAVSEVSKLIIVIRKFRSKHQD